MNKRIVYKHRIIIFTMVIVIFYSALGLDYSGLVNFSVAKATTVFKHLCQPDLTYFYDGSGEDVISLIVITLATSFLGVIIATFFSMPLTLVSAKTLWPAASFMPRVGKIICNMFRSLPVLIYAILFVKVVGPGSYAGALAIGMQQAGMLAKLFTEEMEAMDHTPVEAMISVGADFWQVLFYARLPNLAPMYSSIVLNYFEIAIRSATILGLVGAGGIGAPLIFAIQARHWPKVSSLLIGIIITVYSIDQLTARIRKKLK